MSRRFSNLRSGFDFFYLFGGDADGAVEGNSGTREKSGEEVTLIAFGVGEETAGVEGASAFSGEDEGKVVAAVFVAVFEAGTPHHDAVVEESAVTFAEVGHFIDHVGKLIDVEFVDCGHFADLFLVFTVVGLGMV